MKIGLLRQRYPQLDFTIDTNNNFDHIEVWAGPGQPRFCKYYLQIVLS